MPFPTWLAFFLASMVISVSPGPGAVASMSSGAAYGWRRGYWNTFGLQLGIVLQMGVIALGLGALIATTPAAYEAVRWFGVVYLVYVGIRLWLPPRTGVHAPPVPLGATTNPREVLPVPRQASRRALVVRGFLINCSNPKALIFLLAVLPQFLTRDLPQLPQYALMTVTLVAVDAVTMAVYTLLGARLLSILQSPRQRLIIDRAFGALFFLVALGLALHRHVVS